jgi:hypothetical protein
MENNQINEQVMNFFKAFTHVKRLKIAGLLVGESLTVTHIAERSGLSPKEAMDHLGYLTHFGYLKSQANTYTLDSEAFNSLSRQVLQGTSTRAKMEDFEGEDYERKVLKDFIAADGHLTAVPTQQKKRLVVLHHIVQAFEPGVKYPEKQVNEILRRFNPDTASLRRYLVDDGLLTRENSVYWRPN